MAPWTKLGDRCPFLPSVQVREWAHRANRATAWPVHHLHECQDCALNHGGRRTNHPDFPGTEGFPGKMGVSWPPYLWGTDTDPQSPVGWAAADPPVPGKLAGLLAPVAGRVHSVTKDDPCEATSGVTDGSSGALSIRAAESHRSQVWLIQELGFP